MKAPSKAKQEASDVKLSRIEFQWAFMRFMMRGGHSFDEWDVETTWDDYRNGTSEEPEVVRFFRRFREGRAPE